MILEQSGTLAPANEPWTLIRDAIHDLELQEKQEGVRIDMNEWHDPIRGGGVCYQCLAGSVMSRRLGADTDDHASPDNFPGDVRARLYALNLLRGGEVNAAYRELKLELPYTLPSTTIIPRYHHDPAAFKAAMLAIADLLESAQPTKP